MNGARFGKYRRIAKLGQGGMASVYLTVAGGVGGFHKLLVLKELREALSQDPDFVSMFLDEARLAARLTHPNIVQTFEIGDDGTRYFIAMEYLEGQALNVVLRRIGRPLFPLHVHLKVLIDVLAGLEYAHTLTDFDGSPLGIVHRDVSPQNIFVTYDGQVKLVDFGIAKAAGSSTTTKEGVLKGKFAYIAPEHARGERVDARADVFAVGVMLWEAISGQRITAGDDELGIMGRRINNRDPKIRDVAPTVDAELAAICDRAMANDLNERFPSARALGEALENYLDGRGVRLGAKDIASSFGPAFRVDRERVRSLIDAQLKKSPDDILADEVLSGVGFAGMGLRPGEVSHATPLRMPTGRPSGFRTTGDTPAASPLTHPSFGLTKPQTWKRRGGLAITAGVVLAVGAIAVLTATRESRREAHDGSAPTAASHVGATADPSQSIAVVVQFPVGARLKLDGGQVQDNPFRATVPRDGSIHQFEVEQKGFAPVRRAVTFDKDITLSLDMTPLSGDTSSSSNDRSSNWSRQNSSSRSKSRPSAAVTTATTAPAVVEAPPVDDPPNRNTPKPSVELDEQNPYKKKP